MSSAPVFHNAVMTSSPDCFRLTEYDDAERVRVELMAVAERSIQDALRRARDERVRVEATDELAQAVRPAARDAFHGGLVGATVFHATRETLDVLEAQLTQLLAQRATILVRAYTGADARASRGQRFGWLTRTTTSKPLYAGRTHGRDSSRLRRRRAQARADRPSTRTLDPPRAGPRTRHAHQRFLSLSLVNRHCTRTSSSAVGCYSLGKRARISRSVTLLPIGLASTDRPLARP